MHKQRALRLKAVFARAAWRVPRATLRDRVHQSGAASRAGACRAGGVLSARQAHGPASWINLSRPNDDPQALAAVTWCSSPPELKHGFPFLARAWPMQEFIWFCVVQWNRFTTHFPI